MNINETNYENYFLLYIDKELSAAENAAVENFVVAYPAYAAELDQLKKTIQAPEDAIFDNKALLYRLPAMEASLSPNFKNKLYKKPARLFKVEFNNQTKSALLSVAAVFVLLIGYRFIETNSVSSFNSTVSNTVKPNAPKLSSDHASLEKKDAPVYTTVRSAPKKINYRLSPKEELVPAINPIATINVQETNNLMVQSMPITKEANNIQTSDLPSNEIAQVANVLATNTTSKETSNVTETTTYQVVDTDEEDRSIYIANLEIDAAALRGITRRFNAIFKRNKSENK